MYTYNALVTYVVDGDTLDVDIDLGFEVHIQTRLRLNGINAPEVRGESRELGLATKQVVTNELLNQKVVLKSESSIYPDKYGRWVATIYLNDQNYNQSLVDRGLAVIYS